MRDDERDSRLARDHAARSRRDDSAERQPNGSHPAERASVPARSKRKRVHASPYEFVIGSNGSGLRIADRPSDATRYGLLVAATIS